MYPEHDHLTTVSFVGGLLTTDLDVLFGLAVEKGVDEVVG